MIKLMNILAEELPEILEEAKYIYVVRNKKKKRRLEPRPGYKIVNGKYKKMSGTEKMARKIAQRKAAKKRKAKKSQINRKRRLSLQKRRSMGLKRRR